MKVLKFLKILKKFKLKNDTMNESHLQRLYIYPI